MNRRLKCLILILLAAVLCLSAAILSTRRTDSGGSTTNKGTVPAEDSALTLFVGTNGLWGARSATGRIMIEPTWYYLRVMSSEVLIARHNDGTLDRFGLIRTNGEQLIPSLYNSFEELAPDIWLATLTENNQNRYHLYRENGTRWMNRTWDSCESNGSRVTVTQGRNTFTMRLTNSGVQRENWLTDYPVGLHSMTMDFDADALAKLPDDETLLGLGNATADFLIHLFVTHTAPENAQTSGGDIAALKLGTRYRECRLKNAAIERIDLVEGDEYPTYRLLLRTEYSVPVDGNTETAPGTMILYITRNAAGAYLYKSLTDNRMDMLVQLASNA